MSKPRKEIDPEILKNLLPQVEEKEDSLGSSNLTNLAIGIHRDPKQGWSVAKIKYDPETKQAEVVDVVHTSEKLLAIEQFKILASREIL